jgi:hypothetical protein
MKLVLQYPYVRWSVRKPLRYNALSGKTDGRN